MESVNYIISLTDSIIAGNMLGADVLVAIGLLTPFLALSLFMASIINSVTIMQVSSHIGAFRKQRALEFFSQGVYMALLTGAAYAAVLLSGVQLIIRDSGKSFDITNGDERVTSFRQYVISNLMTAQENKAYILTTEYNRIELLFGK